VILRALYRYPVKSMLGEELAESGVTARGLDGDRTHALLDRESGRVASAKYPRDWQRLLTLTAAHVPGGVRIEDVDGKPLDDRALSERLGRDVELIDTPPVGGELRRAVPDEVLAAGADSDVGYTVNEFGKGAPPGTFFDFAPLHLVTTATLAGIGRLSPRGTVEPQRYRPNLLIESDADAEPFAENGWVGRELAIGDEVRLKILVPTPRCAVPTLVHGELPRDTEALRIPARHNRVEPLPGLGELPCVGAYAQVLAPGRIRRGDRLRLV